MPDAFLPAVVARLAEVPGVEAIVLGGSRAQDSHAETSDWDLGLYFESAEAFNVVALNRVAATLDDAHREDLCTPIGGWGPWVVGGGWLTIDGRFAALTIAATPYPVALRAAIFSRLRGEPAFCAAIAEKGLARGDLAYVATSLSRAVFCLAQLLFALNSEWYLNEKGATARAARFARTVPRLDARVQAAFGSLGADPAGAIATLRTLAEEVVALTRES